MRRGSGNYIFFNLHIFIGGVFPKLVLLIPELHQLDGSEEVRVHRLAGPRGRRSVLDSSGELAVDGTGEQRVLDLGSPDQRAHVLDVGAVRVRDPPTALVTAPPCHTTQHHHQEPTSGHT